MKACAVVTETLLMLIVLRVVVAALVAVLVATGTSALPITCPSVHGHVVGHDAASSADLRTCKSPGTGSW